MNFFELTNHHLYFRNDGELLCVSPWGDNSLRVQSSLMDQIPEGEIALISPEVSDASAITAGITVKSGRNFLSRNGAMPCRSHFTMKRAVFCFVR